MRKLFLALILFSTSAFGALKIHSWSLLCSASPADGTPAVCEIHANVFPTEKPKLMMPISKRITLSPQQKTTLKAFLKNKLTKFKTDEKLQ